MMTEFRSSWLQGESKRYQSGMLPVNECDVIIAASSWDSRCLCLTKELKIKSEFSIMLEFEVRDNRGLRDLHDPSLEKFLRSVSSNFIKIVGNSSVVDVLCHELETKLVEIANRLGRSVSIFLDISTFPRFLTGQVLSLALKRGLACHLVAFYSEGVYPTTIGDLQTVFTGERWRFVPIRGFEGNYDPTKSRYFLLSVGFEGAKTLRYLSTQEPDRVSVMFADPGFETSYPTKSRANNAALIEYFHIPPEQMLAAHAGDAIAAWAELTTRNVERFSEENISYLCCGTKPHSLALMLRALCKPSATVLYNVPDQHKVINTVPTGFVWTYEMRDVTRL